MNSTTKFLLIAAVGLTLAIVVVVVTFLNRAAPSNNGMVAEVVQARRPVKVLALSARDVSEKLERTGVLKAKRDVILMSEVMGKVRKVHKELGDTCKTGKALVQLGAESYSAGAQQARAAVAQAKVGRTQAKQDLERAKALADKGVLPPQELDSANNAFQSAEAAVKQAEAALRLAQSSLHESTVRCPFDGVVAQRMVNVGQLVGPQTPLYRVVDTTELELTLQVSAAELASMRVGQPVTLADSSVDDLVYDGKVARLGVAADPGTHTFPVQITVPGSERGPRPGQVVRASVVVAVHERALLVPSDAVRTNDVNSVVFVAKGEQAHRISVELGPRIGSEVIVRKGLKPGDDVIVVGQEGLAGGDAITAIQPGASASASAAEAPVPPVPSSR